MDTSKWSMEYMFLSLPSSRCFTNSWYVSPTKELFCGPPLLSICASLYSAKTLGYFIQVCISMYIFSIKTVSRSHISYILSSIVSDWKYIRKWQHMNKYQIDDDRILGVKINRTTDCVKIDFLQLFSDCTMICFIFEIYEHNIKSKIEDCNQRT